MPLYHILILSLIQGLTEFLPISSSGHLIIFPQLLGWKDQGIAMDVAVHLGTLGAVLLYFWRDVLHMISGFFKLMRGRVDEGGKMALWLIIGTIPTVLLGSYLSYKGLEFRSLIFIGWTTLLYGLLLGLIDRVTPEVNSIKSLSPLKSLLVGIAQALALFPGTSRSGACMTMGRLLGMKRQEAARFAFLLAIPAISAAGLHTGLKFYHQGTPFFTPDILWAIGASFIFGLMAINFMMKWLQKGDFTPFVIYRVLLGAFLLALGYGYF
jgi:undecaprenyl-diphosphatase